MPRPRARIAIAAHRDQPVDEIGRLRPGNGSGFHLSRLGGGVGLIEGSAANEAVVDPAKRRMHRRGSDAIEPGPPVLGARRSERRARDLLGIETAAAAAAARFGRQGVRRATASVACSLPKPVR